MSGEQPPLFAEPVPAPKEHLDNDAWLPNKDAGPPAPAAEGVEPEPEPETEPEVRTPSHSPAFYSCFACGLYVSSLTPFCSSQPEPESAVVQQLRSMLNKRLRVKVTDGRVLTGQFYCYDNLRNIMLSEAKEAANETDTNTRHLGLVLIPWKWVVACHLEQIKPRFPD